MASGDSLCPEELGEGLLFGGMETTEEAVFLQISGVQLWTYRYDILGPICHPRQLATSKHSMVSDG